MSNASNTQQLKYFNTFLRAYIVLIEQAFVFYPRLHWSILRQHCQPCKNANMLKM